MRPLTEGLGEIGTMDEVALNRGYLIKPAMDDFHWLGKPAPEKKETLDYWMTFERAGRKCGVQVWLGKDGSEKYRAVYADYNPLTKCWKWGLMGADLQEIRAFIAWVSGGEWPPWAIVD